MLRVGLAVSSVALAALPAQNADAVLPRGLAFGEARTSDGKPWAGAKIALLSRPWARDHRAGDSDRVEAVADERGRFRARVVIGRNYSAWAWSEAEIEGSRRMSGVVERVTSGTPVVLRETATRASARFEFRGLERWKGKGPFRLSALADLDNDEVVEGELDGENSFVVPALPKPTYRLELLDAAGRPLLVENSAGGESRGFDVRPPSRKVFTVRDIDSEKGVGGATIWVKLKTRLARLGETDKDGVAVLEVPDLTRMGNQLVAGAPGYAMGWVCSGAETRKNGKKWPVLRSGLNADYYTRIGKGHSVRGRVLLGPDRPAAGLSITVDGRGLHYDEKSSRRLSQFERLVRTSANGEFTLRDVFDEYPAVAHLVLSHDHTLGLPKSWQRGLEPVIVAALPMLSEGKPVRELGDVALYELCPVELRVMAHDRAPGSGARVEISDAESAKSFATQSVMFTADRVGRVRMLVKPGRVLTLAVRHSGAIWAGRLVTSKKKGSLEFAKAEVRLPERYVIAGVVLDGDGKPVVNAQVRCTPMQRDGRFGGAAERGDADIAAADGNQAVLTPLGANALQFGELRRAFRPPPAHTDERGRFEIAVPNVAMQFQLYASSGGKRVQINVQVDGETPLEPVELRFK